MTGLDIRRIIAINIKRIRREMSLTQAELSERTGMSSGYMCDIERARRWPSADKLAKITEVLKMEPFQLLLPSEDSPYFDRRKTLTTFSKQVREALNKNISEVYEGMISQYESTEIKTPDE